MGVRNISAVLRVPECVLDVSKLFQTSAVAHSNTGLALLWTHKQAQKKIKDNKFKIPLQQLIQAHTRA